MPTALGQWALTVTWSSLSSHGEHESKKSWPVSFIQWRKGSLGGNWVGTGRDWGLCSPRISVRPALSQEPLGFNTPPISAHVAHCPHKDQDEAALGTPCWGGQSDPSDGLSGGAVAAVESGAVAVDGGIYSEAHTGGEPSLRPCPPV